MLRRFLTAVLLLLPALVRAEGAPSEKPILRIETGGIHTAQIRRIDVDASERFLVTGSHDKTIRVWDLERNELEGVLRPPIGEGREGKIYAVAISPDGQLVAAGGWTGFSWDSQISVYLFNRRTRQLLRRISGLPETVCHLAFSSDGSRLAITLGDGHGLRIIRVSDGQELLRDTSYGDSSYGVSFATDGRLAVSSLDGMIRLYLPGRNKPKIRVSAGGKNPFGVAFSPDGTRLAIGYKDSMRVDVLEADSLELIFTNETTETSDYPFVVAWSIDGEMLFAAGQYGYGNWTPPIHRWVGGGQGSARVFRSPSSTVMGLRSLHSGRLLFGAGDPAWGILDVSGELVAGEGPLQFDPRGILSDFRVGQHGKRLSFSLEHHSMTPTVFNLLSRQLTASSSDVKPLIASRTVTPGFEITGWENTTELKLGGESLLLEEHERSRSLAIAPAGQSFLLGTEWWLRSFARDGTQRWQKPAPGVAWAVNLTPDDRLALAAFADGTIRWYRAADGEELLAFFPHKDGKRWVVWTPSGYYDASPGGEDLIGWHINQGPDKEALFYSAWHFRDTYRRPDVIDHILDTLDEAEALRKAGVLPAAAPGKASSKPPPPMLPTLPPVLTILDPADGVTFSAPKVQILVSVRSPSGAPVDAVHAAIDGRVVTSRAVDPSPSSTPNARNFERLLEVPVPPRDTTIEITAEAAGRTSPSARLRLRWSAPTPKAERRVWVLAVGVSNYERPEYKLDFAAKDARDLAAAWKKLEGRGVDKVETRILTDGEATRDDILDALDWLAQVEADTIDDLVVVFLAGHGINDAREYFFLPHDADLERRNRTLLSQSQIHSTLRSMPGRVLLFLDTCRAGSLVASSSDLEVRKRIDPTGLINDMAYNAGVIVYSAATSRQLSQESPDWNNGAFTKALVDALGGSADTDRNGEVTSTELEGYLGTTVSTMTGGAQTPTSAKGSVPALVVVPAPGGAR